MGNVVKRQTLGGFLSNPKTNELLDRTLNEKKGEFVSNLIALAEGSPLLKECDPAQLMQVAMNATALNLPLNKNLGYAYVIPYKNKKKGTVVPQFQIGYKGLIQLAIRTGKYERMRAFEVREGEMKYNKFTGDVEFVGERPNSPVVGYYAMFKMLNGFVQSDYITVEEAMNHADRYSQAFSKISYNKLKNGEINQSELWKYSSPWYDSFDEMAIKTILKRLLSKYGMLSTEFQEAIKVDSEPKEMRVVQEEQTPQAIQVEEPKPADEMDEITAGFNG